MSESKMRVALLGCGEIAATHVRALARLDDVEICAVADPSDRRRSAIARMIGDVPAYAAAEELLRSEEPDAVHVLTPPQTHAPLAIAAMEAGAHVLVEKPMALSTQDADRMVEARDRTGRTLGVCHNWVFKPAVERAAGLVESGAVGDVARVEVFWGQSGGYADAPGSHWAWRLPGGVFTNVLPHAISLQQLFLGDEFEVRDVVVVRDESRGSIPTELSFVVGSPEAWGSTTISTSVRPAMKYVDVFGTRAVLRIDLSREICVIQRPRRVPGIVEKVTFGLEHAAQLITGTATTAVMAGLGKWRNNPGMAPLIADFYGSIRSGGSPLIDAARGRRTVETMEAVWDRSGPQLAPRLGAPEVEPRTEAEGRTAPSLRGRRAVVTGATGFLGAHLARALHRCGAEVAVVVRDRNRLALDLEAFTEVFEGSVGDPGTVRGALRSGDIVFHCAAITTNKADWQQHLEDTVTATEVLLEGAAAAEVDRVVHVSSVAVYGMERSLDGRTIDEQTPLSPTDDPWDKYARAKVEAEQTVRRFEEQEGLRITIARPGILYGPGRPVKAGVVRLGNWWVAIGSGKNALPYTFVGNAVDALLLMAASDEAVGEAFNVVDDPQGSAAAVLSAMEPGERVRIIPFPAGVARFLARLAERRAAKSGSSAAPLLTLASVRGATRDIRYDTGKLSRMLDWHSEVRPAEAARLGAPPKRTTGGVS